MPTKPWVNFRQPHPDGEYLVLLSELPLKRYRDMGAFLLYTLRIQAQLRQSPELLGYSMRAHLIQRQFWTLSVWESEAALQHFVAAQPHHDVMQVLREKMNQTHFVRWRIRGVDFPPRWREALEKRDPAG